MLIQVENGQLMKKICHQNICMKKWELNSIDIYFSIKDMRACCRKKKNHNYRPEYEQNNKFHKQTFNSVQSLIVYFEPH